MIISYWCQCGVKLRYKDGRYVPVNQDLPREGHRVAVVVRGGERSVVPGAACTAERKLG